MITTDFQYKTLASANKKIVDLQDKLSKQLKINEGSVLESRQLKAQVARLSKKVAELESVVNKQSEIIDKLMRKLGLNSHNSSVPPSKNGLNQKPRSGNSREKSGKKSGGQVGHKGTTLEFSAHADEEIEHKPTKCIVCGAILSGGYEHIETRQIHDVLIQKIISNHLIFVAKCSCGGIEKANPSIACGVSYGAGLKSILSYLGNYMLIPNERLSELSGSLFKSPLSEGTLQNWQVEISNRLTAYHEDMEDILLNQALLHVNG